MRFCSFAVNNHRSFGLIDGDRIVDLKYVLAEREGLLLPDLRRFVEAGAGALDLAAAVLADAGAPRLALRDAKLLAPLRNPRKIICIGLNYRDHCEESKVDPPKNPIWFPKFANAIQDPGGPVVLPPKYPDQVDYEGELAVVMGRKGRNIAESEALDYVFGYTILHDVSARDVQFSDGQWGRGKAFDTFAPLGPVLVARDEIPDPNALAIKTEVNGRVLQDSNTSKMVFPVPYLISFLSHHFTFEAGDIISTGTPYGVGAFRDPKIFLRPGDTVRITIEGIGTLENPVVAG